VSIAAPVAGRYELVRPLGHGATAVVDLARDIELDRSVALKRLAENLARDEDVRQRFLREARLAARLSHPNVVRVFDVGEDDGRPFIAMEYVEGGTLADLVARRGSLTATEAATLGVQACTALAAAHTAGLVHRDVKPQNLLLGTDGVLKLGDFGIAVGYEGTRLTLVGTVLGTVGYLAPEQARGEEVTGAADIYAVGAVLYELLTGEPPRSAGSLSELGAAGFHPPDVARRVAGVPGELADVVTECLAVRAEDRPPSAADLARRLARLASEDRTLTLPADPEQRATEILAPATVRRSRLPLRTLAAAAALVCAAVVGLVVAVVVAGGGHPSRPGSAPRAVAPPPTGANVVEQARALAAWLRRH
jgi:eukaryotic-like serine/threonine-protein kinase